MSRGTYVIEVPHICGEVITVRVNWWQSGYSYDEPPDSDTEFVYEDLPKGETKCPKCGVDLEYDDLFYRNIEKAEMTVTDHGGYVQGDEEDYEPLDEPEPYWEGDRW